MSPWYVLVLYTTGYLAHGIMYVTCHLVSYPCDDEITSHLTFFEHNNVANYI